MKITNNVYQNLNLANEDDRGENLIIDFVISSFFGILIAYLTFTNYTVAFFTYAFVRFLYYFVFELVSGRTPGKYQTLTKVVNKNGNKPSIGQLIIRTLSRSITVFSGLSDDERTIHDNFSNTFVIKDLTLKKIEFKYPLILIFNLSILGCLIYYVSSKSVLETIDIIALFVLILAFVSGLIFGIKKMIKA